MTANDIKPSDFYDRLSLRVSTFNARMMLRSAMVTCGVQAEDSETLGTEQAKAICMALINKGGPSFQVGKDMYSLLQ